MPKISIIMPVFNAEKTVAESIKSALSQTFHDFDVIVCIDGAEDASEQIVRGFGDVVRVVSFSRNRGLATARNMAISESVAEFFLPLDSDDLIDPTFLEKTLPLMADERVGVACTDMQYFGTRSNYIRSWETGRGAPMTKEDEYHSNNIPICSLVRRKAFDEVPEGYHWALWGHEDWSLWISILSRGWNVAVVHEPLFRYRCRHGSLSDRADRHRAELDSLMREIHGDIFKGGWR